MDVRAILQGLLVAILPLTDASLLLRRLQPIDQAAFHHPLSISSSLRQRGGRRGLSALRRSKAGLSMSAHGNELRHLDRKRREPSTLNPTNPAMRTGRRREWHRRNDRGIRQMKRWKIDDKENDIPRGNWTYRNDAWSELVHDVDWERQYPHYYDQNIYKRTPIETQFLQHSYNDDNYFDIQFIGSANHHPATQPVGMNFGWKINWVPWERKKRPRRTGQPLKSIAFNMGGIEPLQLWFWPEGLPHSLPGYAALHLVSPPGWHLPYPLRMWMVSEHGQVVAGPFMRHSKEYIKYSHNFARLMSYREAEEEGAGPEDLVLGPAGNVYVGVGIADESWNWDDGAWDYEDWIKKRGLGCGPDPVGPWLTVSEEYENFKYRDTPDRHFAANCRSADGMGYEIPPWAASELPPHLQGIYPDDPFGRNDWDEPIWMPPGGDSTVEKAA